MAELTDPSLVPLTDDFGAILVDVQPPPVLVPQPQFPSLIPGSIAWMNQSMRTVNPVLTTDRFGGILIVRWT